MQSVSCFSGAASSPVVMAPPMQQTMTSNGPTVHSLSDDCSPKVCVIGMGGAVATLGLVALGAGIVKGTPALICLGGVGAAAGFATAFGGCSMKE